jgi:small subunit ribosomal protein S16
VVFLAVRIRLKKVGRRHQPAYRIAATDSRRNRDSIVIEELGSFNPLSRDETQAVHLHRDRILYWLGVGAQPSVTVRRILEKQGVLEPVSRKDQK